MARPQDPRPHGAYALRLVAPEWTYAYRVGAPASARAKADRFAAVPAPADHHVQGPRRLYRKTCDRVGEQTYDISFRAVLPCEERTPGRC